MIVVHAPVLLRVAELNPAAYNPRKISPEKFEALKESIRESGFVESLVVQKKGLRIVAGHQRLRAVKEMCVEESVSPPDLPCVVLDLNDKQAKRLNIKMNKIRGDFDARLLGELLVDIYDDPKAALPVEEFSLLGFDSQEAESLIRLIEPDRVPLPRDEGGEGSAFGKSITLSVEFDSVAMRDKVKKLLVENAKTAKQKTGHLVAMALGLGKKKPAKKAARA